MSEQKRKKCVRLFAAIVFLVALAIGLSATVFSNYFRDAFAVNALQRGSLETPRESGGLFCVVLFSLLAFMGNASLGILAMILTASGIFVMAFLQPGFGGMIWVLILFSMGQHLFMPVNDSLAMSLAEDEKGGTSLGFFKRFNDLGAMLAGMAIFIGFRIGLFSFTTPIILPFAIAMVLFLTAGILLILLRRELPQKKIPNNRMVFRKEYIPYYLATFAFGCQKRVRIVFGPWVLIELLSRGADTIALMTLISRLVSSFIAPRFGKFLDRKGLKVTMQTESAYMIVVFLAEGLLAGGLASGALQGGIWFWIACVGFILTNIIDQFHMVHSLLMRRLAGERKEDVSVSLSMGISIDHIMAVVVSPLLGAVWTLFGPQWVFYIVAGSALIQLAVARWMLPAELRRK